MAITITEGCEVTPVERAGAEQAASDIEFHRHCQKTVCSAHGYNGNGATWSTLSRTGQDSDLPNLPSGWVNKFSANGDNITQDLRSILELINSIAGNMSSSWRMTFNDYNGNEITTVTINPRSSNVVGGFGRQVNLSINGTALRFNTMQQHSDDVLSMNVKHDLTIKYDGEVVGTANDMFMPSDATIDIVPDHNIISCSGYSSFISQYGAAPIDGRYHVYRHHENTASSITPKFAVDRKYLPPEDYGPSPIIEWEFHIRNDLASGNITVNPPSVTVGGNSNYFTKVVALTDQMYVERGKTNVYVFRVDTYSTAKALTYSLAYIY